MAKFYHDNETDEIVSLDKLRYDWERFMQDGTFSADEREVYSDFVYYFEACMYYNNGSLTPLRQYIHKLRSELSAIDDPTEIIAMSDRIMELTRYESEV